MSAEMPAPAMRPVAITDVTVVPMDRPGTIPHQTVVVEDGRIRAVGPATEINTPQADVVEGKGRYLMPALADMHVHIWDTEECGMFLANGVTTVRNMWGSPFHLAYQKAVEKRQIAGPRLATTSPIVDGLTAAGTTAWPGSIPLTEPEPALEMVEGFAERGYQQVKAYSWLTADALRGLGEASSATGLALVGHCPEVVSFEEAIETGMTCFEHLTNIWRGRLPAEADSVTLSKRAALGMRAMSDVEFLRVLVEGLDLESVRRLGESMAERGVWNCPTVVVWQQIFRPPDEAVADPRNAYVSPAGMKSWDPGGDFWWGPREERDMEAQLAAVRRRDDLLRVIVGILHDAGAPLLVGSDTPNPFVYQGFGVHDELANFVAAGLTPYEALRCATTEAARFLGESDWGTVAPGARADLLLLRADPLSDISAASQIEAVFTNGWHFNRHDLDEMLRRRIESVAPERASLPAELHEPPEHAEQISAGRMRETLGGAPAGQMAYRCCAIPGGGRVIEEVNADPTLVTRRRVWLGSDGLLDRAERVYEYDLGEDRCRVEWSEKDQTYWLDYEEIDGWRSRRSLGDRRMLPDNNLSALAAPLSGLTGDDLPALSVEDQGQIVSTDLQRSGSEVKVRVKRPNGPSRQRFVLHGDCVVRATSNTWQGERVLEPADTDTAGSS